MRIGQAIDNVYQNNKLEYKSETLKVFFDPLKQSIRIQDLTDDGFYNVLSDNFKNEKFKLIQKPVSFMEAVASGKRFRVEHFFINPDSMGEYTGLKSFLNKLTEVFHELNIHKILIEGKFYIQGED